MESKYIRLTPRKPHAPKAVFRGALIVLLLGIMLGIIISVNLLHVQAKTPDVLEVRVTFDAPESELTDTGNPATEEPESYYALTPAERLEIEQVVAAEAIGEPYEGQMAVAECILNACEKDGIRPAKAITKYQYAKGRKEPTGSIIEAVSAVFDKGEAITDEPIIYFYAPGRVTSDWHERQTFVTQIGGHKFFAEK